MAFSILNTPKKLGNSLLRKAASKKAPPKPHLIPAADPRPPRIATTTASATATPWAKGKQVAPMGGFALETQ